MHLSLAVTIARGDQQRLPMCSAQSNSAARRDDDKVARSSTITLERVMNMLIAVG
jgi:hypothetical protein